jgi:predicted DNA repair protein MutK
VPLVGGLLAAIAPTVIDAVAGVIVGAVVLLGVTIVQRLRGKK